MYSACSAEHSWHFDVKISDLMCMYLLIEEQFWHVTQPAFIKNIKSDHSKKQQTVSDHSKKAANCVAFHFIMLFSNLYSIPCRFTKLLTAIHNYVLLQVNSASKSMLNATVTKLATISNYHRQNIFFCVRWFYEWLVCAQCMNRDGSLINLM